MAKIFITGSTEGLGQLTAKLLISQGHEVVLHARNSDRALDAQVAVPTAKNILIADLDSMQETKELAEEVNALGPFDAIIHNAAVYQVPKHELSRDRLPVIPAVNTLATYILTCLIEKPKRLIYMSSDMHLQGDPSLADLMNGTLSSTYSDTKLHVLLMSMAVARHWPDVYSNAVHPGWVPTKMGGEEAPDDLEEGYQTQAWLAVSEAAAAKVSGHYFHHKKQAAYLKEADDVDLQEKLLQVCEKLTGVKFPDGEEGTVL